VLVALVSATLGEHNNASYLASAQRDISHGSNTIALMWCGIGKGGTRYL